MKIIDLAQPIWNEGPNCPAHPPLSVRVEKHTSDALNSWQIEHFAFASHSGSHIDAPLHKIRGGRGLETFDLGDFEGRAHLCDLRSCAPNEAIDRVRLEPFARPQWQGEIVLLATGWGQKRAKTPEWLRQSPYLNASGAQFLVEQGVRAVGIDHYSVGGSAEPRNAHTHQILLGAGLWIVEELRFPDEIFAFPSFQFQAFPLNVINLEGGISGAPCRPLARVELST